VRPPGS